MARISTISMMEKKIYADYNATCPCDPKHFDEVIRQLKEVDGNPSSIHYAGREAKVAVEQARGQVAKLLGAKPRDLIFTSGATESNNMVLQGLYYQDCRQLSKPRLVMSATEHAAVAETAKVLEKHGYCRVVEVPVDNIGRVDRKALLAAIDHETKLVSVIYVNNEVGTINPMKEIASEVRASFPDVHIHIDAVQAFGKLDMSWLGSSAIDSAAISAHKVGGFKGVGGLYLKQGRKLAGFMLGGSQERNRRAGTENVPGIISFGMRARDIGENPGWLDAIGPLRDRLYNELKSTVGVVVHSEPEFSTNNTINFHVDGIPGDDIMINFDLAGIAVSSGSACSSGVVRPSSVLKAMGYDDWQALNSIRVSFGPSNTISDVDTIISTLKSLLKS
jgi:cysteine desulfurase